MAVTSNVTLEIGAPQARNATLWADHANNVKWMDDIDRVEPISGDLGMPGSKYRLVPKQCDMAFVELSRDLPNEGGLQPDGAKVGVDVTDTFRAVGPNRTQLVSTEVFTFKTL